MRTILFLQKKVIQKKMTGDYFNPPPPLRGIGLRILWMDFCQLFIVLVFQNLPVRVEIKVQNWIVFIIKNLNKQCLNFKSMFHNLYATIIFFLIPFSTRYKKAVYLQFDILDLIKEILKLSFFGLILTFIIFFSLLRMRIATKGNRDFY